MRLDEDGSHSGAFRLSGKLQIIEAPNVHVRRTVDVKIDGSFQAIGKSVHLAIAS
jgi:hypothetical protein